jgi:tetratricopeptide (TPR) repeat protein
VNSIIQHLVLATLTGIGVWVALYFVRENRDAEYQGSTYHSDGSSTVQSTGAPLRYAHNDSPYREAAGYLSRGDFTRAEMLFRSIVEKTPDELAALQGLATTLFEQRRYDDSRRTFQLILNQDPHFHNARAGLGAIARVRGNFSEAVEQYSLALQENSSFALSYFGRGVSYYNLGSHDEARSDLTRVLQLLPPTAELSIEAKSYLDRLQ